jgi:hypothetical protein
MFRVRPLTCVAADRPKATELIAPAQRCDTSRNAEGYYCAKENTLRGRVCEERYLDTIALLWYVSYCIVFVRSVVYCFCTCKARIHTTNARPPVIRPFRRLVGTRDRWTS